MVVRQATSALLRKKNVHFPKNPRAISWSSQKMPGDGTEFSKRATRHRRNDKPLSSNVFVANSYKTVGNQKVFAMNITLERKEVISSFERKSSIEGSKTFLSGRVPPTYTTCYSPMMDISVMRQLGTFD